MYQVRKGMGRVLSVLLSAALLFGVFVFPAGPLRAQASSDTCYVSISSGSDSNPGTLSSPFKTIQHAASVMNPGDTCIVREGVYPETVTPPSGQEGAPVTFRAYEGESVTVSGCDPVTGWTAEPGGLYKTSVPLDLGPQNQLFADGEIMYEARYPNVQPGDTLTNFAMAKTGSGTGRSSDKLTSNFTAPAELKVLAGSDPNFFEGATIWTVPGSEWTSLTYKVKSYDTVAGKLVCDSVYRTVNRNYYTPGANQNFFVYGSKNLLDADGEWWYDKESGELYVKTSSDPNGIYIEAKRRLEAFDLSGVSHVEVDGIGVRGSTIITDEDSSYILLQNMKCMYVGHNSEISLENPDNDECPEQDNLGVLLKGSFIEVNSCEIAFSSGPVLNVQGTYNRVVNSYIHDGNYIATYCGHTKLTGRRHLISHNTMAESGRDVVSFRGLAESVVQYNDIGHAGRLTKDLGMMYTANSDGQNTMIHHNILHDNYALGHCHGLYPDEMSNNYIMYQNIIYNVKGNGLMFNQPSLYNLAYNNTTYNKSTYAGSYGFNSQYNDNLGRQLINNIVYETSSSAMTTSAVSTASRNNLNSGGGNPNFASPGSGDFSLNIGSPAIGSGLWVAGVSKEGTNPPAAGAVEAGEPMFLTGHDFTNPPTDIEVPSADIFEYRNLVKNGGFEYGTLEAWSGNADMSYGNAWHSLTKEANAGFYSAKLAAGENIRQTITGLEANTAYQIGLNLRRSSTSSTPEAKIAVLDGEGNDIVKKTVASGNIYQTWGIRGKETLSFVTGAEGFDTVTIEISNTGSIDPLYVDDVGMAKMMSDHTVSFQLSDGSNALDLSKASITLSYTPSTNINYLHKMGADGKSLILPPVNSVTYNYTIQYHGFQEKTGTVTLSKTNPSSFDIPVIILDPAAHHNISFAVTPLEATIVVKNRNGEIQEPLEGNRLAYSLYDGDYHYTVTSPGYVARQGSVSLPTQADDTLTVDLALAPTHEVVFDLAPDDSDVTVKNSIHVVVPPTAANSAVYQLADGNYSYLAEKEGFHPKEGTFSVSGDGQTITLSLEPVILPPPGEAPAVTPNDAIALDLFGATTSSVHVSLGSSGFGFVADEVRVAIEDTQIASATPGSLNGHGVVRITAEKVGQTTATFSFYDASMTALPEHTMTIVISVADSAPEPEPEPDPKPGPEPESQPRPSTASSGSSRYNGSSTPDSDPSQSDTALAETPLKSADAAGLVAEAVKSLPTGQTSLRVTARDVIGAELSILQAMQKSAEEVGISDLRVDFVQMENGREIARLSLLAKEATKSVTAALSITSQTADRTKRIFERWYSNTLIVLSCEERESFGQTVTITIPLPASHLEGELFLYVYNPATNTYSQMTKANPTVKNGSLTFTTQVGGDIIISVGALAKR